MFLFPPRGQLALVAVFVHDPCVVQLPPEIAHDAVQILLPQRRPLLQLLSRQSLRRLGLSGQLIDAVYFFCSIFFSL